MCMPLDSKELFRINMRDLTVGADVDLDILAKECDVCFRNQNTPGLTRTFAACAHTRGILALILPLCVETPR